VNLGSLRLRQDVLLGEGLIPVYATTGAAEGVAANPALRPTALMDLADGPTFGYLAGLDPRSDPVEMAMARVRQLSCHEVGHTLGFAHNYLTSAYGRSSVMDYPAPVVNIRSDGSLDLSDAYPVGVGEFDIFVVKWAYSDFGPGADEPAELEAIISDSFRKGIRFAADNEARPLGAAHPKAALWDNGADPVGYLRHEMAVRQSGLITFGERSIRVGEPLASLEEVLVPLYLHHRYQMESAAHSLGGVDYNYALRGDGQTPLEIVPADKQREALDLILDTLEPRFLALPEETLNLIPPRAFGMASGETFIHRTAPTLDPLGMAATSADFSVQVILQPERMARLVEFHSRNAWYPGLDEVVDALLQTTWYARRSESTWHVAIQNEVQQVVLDRLKREASNPRCTPLVRAALNAGLHGLKEWLVSQPDPDPFQMMTIEDIQRWIDRPESLSVPGIVPAMPPGSPIGIPPVPAIPPSS